MKNYTTNQTTAEDSQNIFAHFAIKENVIALARAGEDLFKDIVYRESVIASEKDAIIANRTEDTAWISSRQFMWEKKFEEFLMKQLRALKGDGIDIDEIWKSDGAVENPYPPVSEDVFNHQLDHIFRKIDEICALHVVPRALPNGKKEYIGDGQPLSDKHLLQMGYNLGRLAEITGYGRKVWDRFKGPVEARDWIQVQRLVGYFSDYASGACVTVRESSKEDFVKGAKLVAAVEVKQEYEPSGFCSECEGTDPELCPECGVAH